MCVAFSQVVPWEAMHYSNNAAATLTNVFGTAYRDCFEYLQRCLGKTDLEAGPVMTLERRETKAGRLVRS